MKLGRSSSSPLKTERNESSIIECFFSIFFSFLNLFVILYQLHQNQPMGFIHDIIKFIIDDILEILDRNSKVSKARQQQSLASEWAKGRASN